MQKYFEKIINRLEDAKGIAFLTLANTDDKTKDVVYDEVLVYMNTAIRIVNQVAEEYVLDTNVGSNDGWIPCKNELPKEYTDVLGCDYDGNIYVVELYKDSIYGNVWRQWNGGLLRLGVILAWQPLPAPYQPKGE